MSNTDFNKTSVFKKKKICKLKLDRIVLTINGVAPVPKFVGSLTLDFPDICPQFFQGNFGRQEREKITHIILLHEKFLQFDWLRAVVFQLNLKYLHVKITTFCG